MRPIKPRFCKVVVVIGVAAPTGVALAEGAASGVVSWASRSTAVINMRQKSVAGRIIDGLNTKPINSL